MITPTVGRVVLFRMRGSDPESQPLAAMIAAVNSDGSINIGYLNTDGQHRNATHVILHQDGEPYPDAKETAFCEWMEYQKEQARRERSFVRCNPSPEDVERIKNSKDGVIIQQDEQALTQVTLNRGIVTDGVTEIVGPRLSKVLADIEFHRDRAADDIREAKIDAAGPGPDLNDDGEDTLLLPPEPTEENTRP